MIFSILYFYVIVRSLQLSTTYWAGWSTIISSFSNSSHRWTMQLESWTHSKNCSEGCRQPHKIYCRQWDIQALFRLVINWFRNLIYVMQFKRPATHHLPAFNEVSGDAFDYLLQDCFATKIFLNHRTSREYNREKCWCLWWSNSSINSRTSNRSFNNNRLHQSWAIPCWCSQLVVSVLLITRLFCKTATSNSKGFLHHSVSYYIFVAYGILSFCWKPASFLNESGAWQYIFH